MRRIITTAVALATAGLVAAAVSFAAPQRAVTLRGSVGPGFTINLAKNGKKVRTLRPGTYRFVIADRSSAHNFVLEKEHGGRFERELTHVGAVGTRTVTLRLTRGTWKYYCEPHESVMVGFFRVA